MLTQLTTVFLFLPWNMHLKENKMALIFHRLLYCNDITLRNKKKPKPLSHYSSVTLIFKYFLFCESVSSRSRCVCLGFYNLLFCSCSPASFWILNRNHDNKKPTVKNFKDNQGNRPHRLYGKKVKSQKWNVYCSLITVITLEQVELPDWILAFVWIAQEIIPGCQGRRPIA